MSAFVCVSAVAPIEPGLAQVAVLPLQLPGGDAGAVHPARLAHLIHSPPREAGSAKVCLRVSWLLAGGRTCESLHHADRPGRGVTARESLQISRNYTIPPCAYPCRPFLPVDSQTRHHRRPAVSERR